jgi:hypothetical protein
MLSGSVAAKRHPKIKPVLRASKVLLRPGSQETPSLCIGAAGLQAVLQRVHFARCSKVFRQKLEYRFCWLFLDRRKIDRWNNIRNVRDDFFGISF